MQLSSRSKWLIGILIDHKKQKLSQDVLPKQPTSTRSITFFARLLRKKKTHSTASGSRGIASPFFCLAKTRFSQNALCFAHLSPRRSEKRRTLPHRAHASCFCPSLARTPPRAPPELQSIQWFSTTPAQNFVPGILAKFPPKMIAPPRQF
jgi:hypothetical protein